MQEAGSRNAEKSLQIEEENEKTNCFSKFHDIEEKEEQSGV